MKETVYLKSNLHLSGVGSRVQFNVLEDFKNKVVKVDGEVRFFNKEIE